MKRSLSWLLLLAMLFTCLSVPAALADNAESSGGVDIVIVLDQSKSMRQTDNSTGKVNTAKSSDPDGYRLDAAQMLVAMADMESSRVAIVPFNQKVTGADTDFVSINTEQKRNTKLNAINNLPTLQPDTDYGEALAVAYNLIANRQDTSNKPVIILLTDGEIYMSNVEQYRTTKPIYAWNSNSQRFVPGEEAVPTTAIAQALADEVVDKCADADIPIYTVALMPPDATGGEDYLNTLRAYSTTTGAKYYTVGSDNANEMPSYFAEVFADLVGSSLQRSLEPVLMNAQTRLYEVEVPILNTSVLEANLFISKEDVVESSLKLLDNHGNEASVTPMNSTHFRMYKIRDVGSDDVGTWKLQFQLKGNAQLSDVSFNLLYNYDLTLSAKIGKTANNMATALSGVNKTDNLQLKVEFLDDSTGQPTTDSNLYKVQHTSSADSWKTIQVRWELLYANDTAVFNPETGMPISGAATAQETSRRFYTTIDLGSLIADAGGYNGFKQGDYKLRITADGAGLVQTDEVAFAVVNQAPTAHSHSSTIKVEDGGDQDSYAPQAYTYNFAELCEISDPDNDEITFADIHMDSVTLGGGYEARDLLDWNPNDFLDDGTVTFTTKEAADGRMLHGEMKLTLVVQDSDGGETEIPVTIRVDSTEYINSQGTFSVTPEQTDNANKNDVVTLTAKAELSAAGSNPDGVEAKIESITGAHAPTQAGIDQINASVNRDGTNFNFSIPTGNRQTDEWNVTIGFYYNGNALLSQDAKISVGNAAPELNPAVLEKIPTDVKFGGSFLSFLEPDTTAEEMTVLCSELFTDTAFNENPDDLTYTVALLDGDGNEIASADSPLAAELNGDVVTLEAKSMGSVTVRFTVTDVDGEQAVAEVEISTANMTVKWTMLWVIALAALIVLILLLRAIYWIQLPRFPKGTQLLVTEGQSISPTASPEVAPGKKPERLLNFVGELANAYHLDGIEQIYIKPLRGRRDGSIYVYMDKKAPAITATLESDELLPGKKNMMVWHVDQRLYVQPAEGGESINIQLRNIEDNVVMDMGGNGWDGGVTNDGLGFGASVEGTGFDAGFDNNAGFDAGFGGTDNGSFAAPADNGSQGFDSGFGGTDNNDIGF